eukprot:7405760-Pyramimonas_sp.AAC.1
MQAGTSYDWPSASTLQAPCPTWWIRPIVTDLMKFAATNDWGAFYRDLRKLKIYVQDRSREGQEQITAEQMISHFEKVGGAPGRVEDSVLERGLPSLPTD